MCFRFFSIISLLLISINYAGADPSNAIALIENDKNPGYVLIINKIYLQNTPKGYILLPKLIQAKPQSTHIFPTPVSFIPYEIKSVDSDIRVANPLEKWPKTIESGKCLWYSHEHGVFKYKGSTLIHYGLSPSDYYCEPLMHV